MHLNHFDKFLKTVDLTSYREKYKPIKIVEMDLPKDIQAIRLLYKVYWDDKKFINYDDFYNEYLKQYKGEIESFREKITMCKDCFYRGLSARIYRTWASIITQIHAGYVAESVFGNGTVNMSAELDSQGADMQVRYKGHFLNYQVKKDSHSGVKSNRPLPRKETLEGEPIDIVYEVPTCLLDPKTKKGEYREPYLRFLKDKRTTALANGFVVFIPEIFTKKKEEIDSN